ncbi:MAG TPA: hypothetical protein VF589_13490, partial [Allosphingosinicella sp.]
LSEGRLDSDVLRALTGLQEELVARVGRAVELTALERGDREDELGDWLDDHGIGGAWELAAVFVPAGLGPEDLDRVVGAVEPAALEPALRWLALGLARDRTGRGR